MGKAAVEHIFTGTTSNYPSYNQDHTILGPHLVQLTGINPADKFAGPLPIALGRPQEVAIAVPFAYPHAIESGVSGTYWIFFADMATAAATRRIVCYEYIKSTQTFNWKGIITLTYPTVTSHTIRALRVARHVYSTGTVGVSGTAVTGSGTGWKTAGYAVGARIGFGSSSPSAISQWYYISAMGTDGSITLSQSAGTIAGGTAYCIEELRVITLNTNATVGNGGFYLAKGVNIDDFSASGTTIPAAVSTDNVKAVYWLKDNAGATNNQQIASGIGFTDATSDSEHFVYGLNADTTTTIRVYKFNVRAALTVSSGASVDAFVLRTGVSSATTGTIPQTNNGRIATASHGPGNGVQSIYFVTVSRVYRIPVSLVQDAAVNFLADAMVEIPPGSATTYAASGALSSIEYLGTIDRFAITTGTAQRHYVTSYQTDGDPWENVWGAETRQIDQSSADPGITPHPSWLATAMSIHGEGGILFICRNGTAATNHHIYAVPVGAHWDYASTSGNRLITPRMATPNATALYRAYVDVEQVVGSDQLGMPPEPFRVYARTTGISDNTGAWTALNAVQDLSVMTPGDYIQLMIEFRILGTTCIPARIFSVCVVYEDNSGDGHFQPSVNQSSAASSIFAWRHSTAFGGDVPALRVRLYNAVTDELIADDNTTTPTGTFERSTNGGSNWAAWTNADKGNETTYIRYTPNSIPSDLTVRCLLTLL